MNSFSQNEAEAKNNAYKGECFFHGKDGYPVDKSKAIFYYERAAELGHVFSMLMAGYMYDFSDGIPGDPNRAIHYYTLAGNNGSADACLNLANVFLFGRGVQKDMAQGTEWLKKAARMGHPVAMSSLGRQYTLGDGVERSLQEAKYWIEKAEESGYINCDTVVNLGLMYEECGDLENAFSCFQKGLGAEPNNSNALYLSAQYLFFGKGTAPDPKRAKEQAALAVSIDPQDKDAQNLLTQIRLYEELKSALDIILSVIENGVNVWDYSLLVFAYDWGFATQIKFKDSQEAPFSRSPFWDAFSHIFTPKPTDTVTKFGVPHNYEAILENEATQAINFNNLTKTLEHVKRDFGYPEAIRFERADHYYHLRWRD